MIPENKNSRTIKNCSGVLKTKFGWLQIQPFIL